MGGRHCNQQSASVVTLIIGVYFIIKSRDVAAYLFKSDDE